MPSKPDAATNAAEFRRLYDQIVGPRRRKVYVRTVGNVRYVIDASRGSSGRGANIGAVTPQCIVHWLCRGWLVEDRDAQVASTSGWGAARRYDCQPPEDT